MMSAPSLDTARFGGSDPVSALSTVAVRGFTNAGEAARAILGLIHELLGLRICVVMRFDREENTATVMEALDLAEVGIHSGTVYPADAIPCDFVARTGAPVREDDLSANPVFRSLPTRAQLGLRTYIGVPLKRGDGSVWGTLSATDRDPKPTTEGHLHVLTVLARLLMLEYERQEQRDALAAHAKALEERLAISEALDEERVRAVRLQTVVEAAATVSHEINNPLTVLQLRLGRLMKRCPPDDAETLDDLQTALEAAFEIQQVTVQLRSVVQPVNTHYLAGKTRMLDLAASTKRNSH